MGSGATGPVAGTARAHVSRPAMNPTENARWRSDSVRVDPITVARFRIASAAVVKYARSRSEASGGASIAVARPEALAPGLIPGFPRPGFIPGFEAVLAGMALAAAGLLAIGRKK